MTASSTSSQSSKQLILLLVTPLVVLQFIFVQRVSTKSSFSSINSPWSATSPYAQPCITAPRNETSNSTISTLKSIAQIQLHSDPDSSRKRRNLVAFTALGTVSAIATVHHNVHAHFLDWDCIVFMHADENRIPSNESRIVEIATHCSIVRLPGVMWSHFLLTLTPELTKDYQHIAVVLDDVFAPNQGKNPVDVPKLLQAMQDFNLSSISPVIKGSVWSSTKQRRRPRCLWRVHHTETFLQIFTAPLFQCWRSFMQYSNPQGFCLDLCLEKQLCPAIAANTMAVDASQIAYHLGRQYMVYRFVPESNRVGVNLSFGMRRNFPDGDYEKFNICRQHECPTNESEIQKSVILDCPQAA